MSGLLAWASHCAASWLAAVILPRFYSVPESSPCILGGGRGVGVFPWEGGVCTLGYFWSKAA